MNNNISIKDVYEIVQRLEDKLDDRLIPLEKDVAEQKGKNAVMAFVISIAVTIAGIFYQSMKK